MSDNPALDDEIRAALKDGTPRKRSEILLQCPSAIGGADLAKALNALLKAKELVRFQNGYWRMPPVKDAPAPGEPTAPADSESEPASTHADRIAKLRAEQQQSPVEEGEKEPPATEDLDDALRAEQENIRVEEEARDAVKNEEPSHESVVEKLLRASFDQFDLVLHEARLELAALRDERQALIRDTPIGPELADDIRQVLADIGANKPDLTNFAPCPVVLALLTLDAARDDVAALFPGRVRAPFLNRAHQLLKELDDLREQHEACKADAD